MTATELAREFMLGFRTNLSCPDVSPSEYEAVMEWKLTQFRNEVLEQVAVFCETTYEGPDRDVHASLVRSLKTK